MSIAVSHSFSPTTTAKSSEVNKNFTDIIATKLIKTDILKSLGCQANNPAFEFELVSRLCKQGCKIKEVPVWYKARSHKEGKTIRAIHMIPALWAIFRIKFLVKRGQI